MEVCLCNVPEAMLSAGGHAFVPGIVWKEIWHSPDDHVSLNFQDSAERS